MQSNLVSPSTSYEHITWSSMQQYNREHVRKLIVWLHEVFEKNYSHAEVDTLLELIFLKAKAYQKISSGLS